MHVTKECSQHHGLAGEFCTITSSNINAIKAGSNVVYASAAGDPIPGVLDSDLVLDGPGNNNAYGHVVLDLFTGTGVVTFSGGTGKFSGFQARVDVSPLGGVNFAWDGTYSFNPPARQRAGLGKEGGERCASGLLSGWPRSPCS